MASQGQLIEIDVDQLVLDLKNSRHEPVRKQEEAIKELLGSEQVIQLALSIAKEDGNPMDLLGVVEKKGTGDRKTYISLEGNRRTCAYILLLDPERIPVGVSNRPALIKKLEKAAADASFSRKRNVVLFRNRKEAKPWIDIMHVNDNDGRNRRRWSSDQRERAVGGGRNKKAMAVLDLAEELGLSQKADREKKLTTVQRYVGNPSLRQILGIDFDSKNAVLTYRSDPETVEVFERFMLDAQVGYLSSRSNAKMVKKYACDLIADLGFGEANYDARELRQVMLSQKSTDDGDDPTDEPNDGDDDEDDDTDPPPPPAKRTKIGVDPELERLFHELGSDKLLSLYRSCCKLALSSNTPLITVGIWSILETLASIANDGETKFVQYFSKDRIQRAGFAKSGPRQEIRKAIEEISRNGNSTKHSMLAASFNGEQLANDMDVLKPFLIAVCTEIKAKGR